MTEIVLANSFLDIHPKAEVSARGIRLLGVDVENVLTDFGNPEVLPGIAEHMEELLVSVGGLKFVLITNKRSDEFLNEVVSQLPGKPGYIRPNEAMGLKKKPSPDMFNFAVHGLFEDVKAVEAAHVDDHFKAWLGANRAGYGAFFWTKPIGEHQHGGVRAFRPFELGIVRPVISLTASAKELFADIR
jgi:beta-phosphoglucomutase-like phosphatase (HAD superfamily)